LSQSRPTFEPSVWFSRQAADYHREWRIERSGQINVLIFIRLDSIQESIERMAMRASQGGHDVPDEKLRTPFERTLANLERAIQRIPHVVMYSNSDLAFRINWLSITRTVNEYLVANVESRGTQTVFGSG
jgi:predicted ABC-type ATPase